MGFDLRLLKGTVAVKAPMLFSISLFVLNFVVITIRVSTAFESAAYAFGIVAGKSSVRNVIEE